MRIRHKVPAIFSLSMVDMLCCALGCVILVWLLNAKQSEDAAAEDREKIEALTLLAQSEREESQRLLSDAKTEHDLATRRVRDLTLQRDQAQSEIKNLRQRLLAIRGELGSVKKMLDAERDKLTKASGRITTLEGSVRSQRTKLEEEQMKSARLAKQLTQRDASLKNALVDLTKRETSLKGLEADLAREKEKAEAALAVRDKELEAARSRLAALNKMVSERQAALTAADQKLARAEKEKQLLLANADQKLAQAEKEKQQLIAAADARFAGIELTGRNVLFLVDTSGSMEMIDDSTTAPEKWNEVCQTVAKLMRSLPKLEKFQLLVFGPKFDYPLGNAGSWFTYDATQSADAALKALKAIKPRAGTNMYVALDEAFRFRKDGLDTIYLLSDGLPNQGEGLTAAQQSTLKGIDRGIVLGKHVRTTLKYNWNKPENGKRVKINTIGFFYESPDLGSFLWALARENEGSFVGMSRP